MKYLVCLVIFCLSTNVLANELTIALEKAPLNLSDRASIKRGGKVFATTCMACHTLVYMRYNRLAKNVGVIYEKMPVNITKWPLDVKPPDLSLEVSRRGADWVYTYLHSFYVDPSRPTGTNNLVLPNTAMTHILAPYQGQQEKIANEKQMFALYPHPQWYNLLQPKTHGSMSPEQFDAMVTDIVNFLAYASEPYRVKQETIGKWVLGFLIILFTLAYLLKQMYWNEIKRKKYE